MKIYVALFCVCMAITGGAARGVTAPVPSSEELYQQGLTLYRQGQYEAAGKLFAQAIRQQNNEHDADYQRGLLLYEQGDYVGAQESFQRAISRPQPVAGAEKQPAAPSQEAMSIPIPGAEPAAGEGEYTLDVGDVLAIKVWQNPDLDDNEVVIRPDGMISFSLAGDLPAKGKTIRAFRHDLTEALKEFIRVPQVSIAMKHMGGKKVMVLGQVANPGVYSVTGPQTVLEAVSLAGGFSDHAVAASVILVRGGFEKPQPRRLDLNRALKKGNVTDNIVLASNDIIYVPKRFIADLNYFLQLFLEPVSRGFYIADQVERW